MSVKVKEKKELTAQIMTMWIGFITFIVGIYTINPAAAVVLFGIGVFISGFFSYIKNSD